MSGGFVVRHLQTQRHRTAWMESGPADGKLMIFLHGWPELGLVWRAQLEFFAAAGRRCVAPDMRGYGASSVPETTNAYALREIVADMLELHDALGGAPAVWVGHDWGSAVAWALASHHAQRCRAVVSLCVPYLARGFALSNLLPLVDRTLYPLETFPAGQWDYWVYYRDRFGRAVREFEADVAATTSFFYRNASAAPAGRRAITANVRAQGGWFGAAGRAPALPRDTTMLSQAHYDAIVSAFTASGFSGAGAWYLNDSTNVLFAGEAAHFGRLALPVLFLHAARDAVCETLRSRLAEPMRADCARLCERTIDGGHELMLERPAEVNAAIARWLDDNHLP